jgi:hypothetical protein
VREDHEECSKRRKKVIKVRYDYQGGGDNAVPVVLLTPGNDDTYCLGRLGCDRVCLMKQDYCDLTKHEKQKLEFTENMIHIMAQATKHTKFAAYAEPAVNVTLLTVYQYEKLTKEQHTVEAWNIILLVLSK